MLRKRARADGVSEDDLEEAEDSDSPKSTIIELILLMTEAVPAEDSQAAELRAELSKLKPSALRKRARADGVGEDALEEAGDSDDPKPAIIELILAAQKSDEDDVKGTAIDIVEAEQSLGDNKLRAELEGMKLKALKKRAKDVGVDKEKLEDADDADDVKGTVIDLIVEAEPTALPDNNQLLRVELEGMKPKALKKRAKEEGVDEEKLEDADDADDVKAAVIGLILERVKESSASEARREEELKLVQAELQGMKVKALKKRAKEEGVDEAELEDADDEEDVKGTVIELILAKKRQAGAGTAESSAELEAQQRNVQLQKLREEKEELASELEKMSLEVCSLAALLAVFA